MPGRQVATVGKIHAEPGAPNVIPGHVNMSLEIRDLSEDKIQTVFDKIILAAKTIEDGSGCRISFVGIDAKSIPAPMDERMQQFIVQAAEGLGYSVKIMPSGAGHDAQNMAKLVPTGMLFVPSIGGISHSPKEFTRSDDMLKGANVILHTVLKLDREGL
jgi:N-carbamoyl-L-amino-acid hydrolase